MTAIGRRGFVALTSAAALAATGMASASSPSAERTRPARKRPTADLAGPPAGSPAGQGDRWAGEFLGSSPMLGGIPPLLARNRKKRIAAAPAGG